MIGLAAGIRPGDGVRLLCETGGLQRGPETTLSAACDAGAGSVDTIAAIVMPQAKPAIATPIRRARRARRGWGEGAFISFLVLHAEVGGFAKAAMRRG